MSSKTGASMPDIPFWELVTQYPDQIGVYATVIAALATVVAVLIACGAIHSASRVARARATLDIFLRETTKELSTDRMEFAKLRKRDDLKKFALPENADEKETALLWVSLNRYELTAIGIGRGIIDKKTYKAWNRKSLVHDWIRTKNFIKELRKQTNNPRLLIEYEKLARRWATPKEKLSL